MKVARQEKDKTESLFAIESSSTILLDHSAVTNHVAANTTDEHIEYSARNSGRLDSPPDGSHSKLYFGEHDASILPGKKAKCRPT